MGQATSSPPDEKPSEAISVPAGGVSPKQERPVRPSALQGSFPKSAVPPPVRADLGTPPVAMPPSPKEGMSSTLANAKKDDKIRVGYGTLAWLRNTSRAANKIPATNFALFSRLPLLKEGKLLKLGTWATGWKDVEIILEVKSCYGLVYHHKERSRRRSWNATRKESNGQQNGSLTDVDDEDVALPNRILILRGATINRSAVVREELEIKCADGTAIHLIAPDARSRDSWIAALDRAVHHGDAQLGDFETYAKLARGHFGTVQLVKHLRTGTALALKTIEMKPKRPEKQYHERHILELLQNGPTGASPFIARLCFAFRDSAHLYLATELASGGDLWALLRKRRRLQEATCRFISAELVLAVRHVHSHGILHRDIKLENLLLDGMGHIKLVDFGLSKRLFIPDGHVWDGRSYTVCGTNYYMPPEMLKKEPNQPGGAHGLATDWWQVGCLVYELIAGAPAFYEKGAAKIHKKILDTGGAPPFPSSLKDAPSHACMDIVDRLLVHNPHRRLGYGPSDGQMDIMSHPFYREIDWINLGKRRIEPPLEIKNYLKGDAATAAASTSTSTDANANTIKDSDGGLAEDPNSAGEDEESIIQRAFPESELHEPMRVATKKYRRIRSLPTLNRQSSTSNGQSTSNTFTTGLSSLGESRAADRTDPLIPVDLGPFLGYEFAVDDNALADARRGSGLILSRWRGVRLD